MENDQLQQNKLGGLPAVWRNWREKTRSWKSLDALPTIPVMAENLEVLDSPRAYRETLLALIASARHRILLAALYLQDDDGGREVLGALYAAKAARPELEIAVFVDWHRAQRGLIGKAKSAGNAAMYREMAQRLGSGVKIYGVPVQRREFMGVLHLKGFVIDDAVLYSGASLNDVYLHRHQRYRLDRYHLIRSRKLADAMSVVLDRTLRHSSAVHLLNTPSAPKTAPTSRRLSAAVSATPGATRRRSQAVRRPTPQELASTPAKAMPASTTIPGPVSGTLSVTSS